MVTSRRPEVPWLLAMVPGMSMLEIPAVAFLKFESTPFWVPFSGVSDTPVSEAAEVGFRVAIQGSHKSHQPTHGSKMLSKAYKSPGLMEARHYFQKVDEKF